MDEFLIGHFLIVFGVRGFGSLRQTWVEAFADKGVEHVERYFLSIDSEDLFVAVFIVIFLHLFLAWLACVDETYMWGFWDLSSPLHLQESVETKGRFLEFSPKFILGVLLECLEIYYDLRINPEAGDLEISVYHARGVYVSHL